MLVQSAGKSVCIDYYINKRLPHTYGPRRPTTPSSSWMVTAP
ncbi:MAG: hypothetical protein R3F30_03150 [Planctomycetota bacterium]